MYHYEMLGDERFQQFCQALLAASFPNVQCLPVGQPDGGRDAFTLRRWFNKAPQQSSDGVIVFQIKYVKNPSDARSERDMIAQVVKSERAKLEKLKSRHDFKYVLITNVKGTSHLGGGSIDIVNDELSSLLGVEAYCWWRDDLDRRLDLYSSVKWSYPEILKATDLLEKLVEGHLGDEQERRQSAIKAYITYQYDDEKELKFKQTDLRSTMADLFVDLPMRPAPRWTERESGGQGGSRSSRTGAWYGRENVFEDYRRSVNAAEFFLGNWVLGRSNVVLEGAPGQGKSTVTQYICQILRMRLLGKSDDLCGMAEGIRSGIVRIPFRVDLRDLARWISGTDPFHPMRPPLDELQPKSLEGFLAAQVRFLSGGHTFNVSDLTAIARASHIFLALDGFDEVAEISLRQQLVTEITRGVSRLVHAGGFSVETIVTSRPAAFAKSVRFPRENWSYFELLPLGQPQIDEYTEKWAGAKGLKDNDRLSLKGELHAKLKEPHTQYLATNPMQLTILLSLINSRGASLPDRRTAMYDAYMETFFTRESEKSEVVKVHRDLLIDLHGFLAWKLHTSAESGGTGSIERNDLRVMLFEYLDREGEDNTIVDALFDGVIERVGVLVSRVQDSYEFEVQPLREYFAAKYLYTTSPYPTDDSTFVGDKFGRLGAVIKNPYWLNVARFYGGCFNKGELMTLASELVELGKDGDYSRTSHPRSVALMFLGDWVFAQYQPAVRLIVDFITEYPQLRQLLANAENGATFWAGLPERSGRSNFLDVLWNRLITTKHVDEQMALSNAIQHNVPRNERFERWKAAADHVSIADWARIGGYLHVYDVESLGNISFGKDIDDDIIIQIIQAGRLNIFKEESHIAQAQRLILTQVPNPLYVTNDTNMGRLDWISMMLSTYQYAVAMTGESHLTLQAALEHRFGPDRAKSMKATLESVPDGMTPAELEAIRAYRTFLSIQTNELSRDLTPWSELVAAYRHAWGDALAVDRIAFLAAGVRSKETVGKDSSLSEGKDLVEVARYIRLRSGAPTWWRLKLLNASSDRERCQLLLLLLMWGTGRTLMKLLDVLEIVLGQLSDDQWRQVVRDFRATQMFDLYAGFVGLARGELSNVLRGGARIAMYIGLRLSPDQRFELGRAMVDMEFDARDPEGHFALQSMILDCRTASRWKSALPKIEALYGRGVSGFFRLGGELNMPESIAEQICANPDLYPLSLVAAADAKLTGAANAASKRLLEISKTERWFST